MVIRNKKNIFKKIFFSQGFLSLVGLIIIISISFPFAKNAIKQYKINQEINNLKKDIAGLQDKNSDLKKVFANLNSDQFAEEQARLNFNLKKSGEELVVIKNSEGLNSTSSAAGDNQKKVAEQLSNPQKWFNYFFK